MVEEVHELPIMSEFPTPIQVMVTDRNGNSMSDVSIDFSVTSGGGSIEPSTVRSDADGIASAVWSLGHIAGEQVVQASSSSRPDQSVSLSVSAAPGPPSALEIPTASLGIKSGQLFRLSAELEDAYGNQIIGYPIIWSTSDPTIAAVDSMGLVSGKVMGSAAVNAAVQVNSPGEGATAPSTGGFSATTLVNVSAGEPATLTKGAEIPEEGVIDSPLESSLTAHVTDFYGNPVSGVEVFWKVEWGGGTLYPESPFTDEDGIAKAQWLLGPEEGIQIANALLPSEATDQPARAPGNGNGNGPSANVVLRFEVKAKKKSEGSGSGGGSADPNVVFVGVSAPNVNIAVGESVTLTVQVQDQAGNSVEGLSVGWSSSSPGVTSISGDGYNASASGVSAGSSLITATVAGEMGWVTIDVDDPSASLGSDDGGSGGHSGDPAVASLALAGSETNLEVGETSALAVQVLDADGDPISGQAVSWSSTNTSVASLDESGYSATATAVSAGASVITAAVGGQAASLTLNVEDPPPPPTTVSGLTSGLSRSGRLGGDCAERVSLSPLASPSRHEHKR